MGEHGDHGHGGGGEQQSIQVHPDDHYMQRLYEGINSEAVKDMKKQQKLEAHDKAREAYVKAGQQIGAIRSLVIKYKKEGKLEDKEMAMLLAYRDSFDKGRITGEYEKLEQAVSKLGYGSVRSQGHKVLKMYRDSWKDAKKTVEKSAGTYAGMAQLYRLYEGALAAKKDAEQKAKAFGEQAGSMQPYLRKM